MGICLETESKPIYNDHQYGRSNGRGGSISGAVVGHKQHDNLDAANNNNNNNKLNVDGSDGPTIPVPVVFVLGGPGSGKITHSETLSRHRKGYVHINMTEKMHQMLEGTGRNDTSRLPTERVLSALESAVTAALEGGGDDVLGLVVSGYPRHLRDVSAYTEDGKLGRVDGVVLLNWTRDSLDRQIEYGASLGQIDLGTARVELDNFGRHAVPVAEYFDYKRMLFSVAGEREPGLIYNDYLKAFDQIVEGGGPGGGKMVRPRPKSSGSYRLYRHKEDDEDAVDEEASANAAKNAATAVVASDAPPPKFRRGKPLVLWVVGGPGSEKTARMRVIALLHPNWRLISVGQRLVEYLRQMYPDEVEMNKDDDEEEENAFRTVKRLMKKGDMVPQETVLDLVMEEMSSHAEVEGFFIAGFPRNVQQADMFEERTGLRPPCVLIDCSEVELGRNLGKRSGRMDDHVDAYRRRLELYRQHTLPMLKHLDEQNRLKIVDGDSDNDQVMKELRRAVHREVAALRRERAVESIQEHGEQEGQEGDGQYRPVDADPDSHEDDEEGEEGGEDGDASGEGGKKKRKKVVRYYNGVNPEVEAELQKVIEELEQKGIPKVDVVQ